MSVGTKIDGYAITSFILGLVGFVTIWIIYLPISNGFFIIFPFSHTPIGILAIIFGSVGYFKKSNFGLCLTGFILGLLTGIFGLIGFLIKINLINL